MKVAVTGAAGFLGLNVVNALVADGHDVLALDRVPWVANGSITAGTVTSAGASAGCETGSGAGASTGAAAAGRSASGVAGAGSVAGAGAVAAGLTSASAAGSTSATVATSRSAAGAGAASFAVAAAAFLVLLRAGLGGSSGWTSRFRPSRSALRRTRSA